MYSINIKGKVTSKDKKLVKLEMIFFHIIGKTKCERYKKRNAIIRV